MRMIFVFVLIVFSGKALSVEENKLSPENRKLILQRGSQLANYPSKDATNEATKFFRYGIKNWTEAGMEEDLHEACVLLFASYLRYDKHNKYKGEFSNCSKDFKSHYFGNGDRKHEPIIKVAPRMPKEAILNGTEGTVLVEYTVKKNGKVKNVKVIESTNKIFNKPAIEATKKFRYLPEIKDKKYREVKSVKNKFTFKVETLN